MQCATQRPTAVPTRMAEAALGLATVSGPVNYFDSDAAEQDCWGEPILSSRPGLPPAPARSRILMLWSAAAEEHQSIRDAGMLLQFGRTLICLSLLASQHSVWSDVKSYFIFYWNFVLLSRLRAQSRGARCLGRPVSALLTWKTTQLLPMCTHFIFSTHLWKPADWRSQSCREEQLFSESHAIIGSHR